ncbi:carbonic anhydrase family protein [Flavobacterium paronense]|uniref:Carbonic anhydrase family protein n=1 Tax=Flavobacterium paronense TaxID=1392775 RepID=A0ABV5GB43_9FLAO|nr:carbonic anhydrase family protein [Flavobacterium paronense]MDN3677367.1 carbonic anhydrase family protein [Flavobacterium paronense]
MMNNKQTPFLIFIALAILLSGCKSKADLDYSKTTFINHSVLTKEQQQALTPDEVLKQFKEGNNRFRKNDITIRKHSDTIRKAATGGQYPEAMVLSCLDSRVPVEDVFDQGIGDVFVGRVAGNFVNTDLLGSMEFACKVAGAKLIIVMGHQHCGAVKGAIDDVKLGNITAMLENIKPAVAMSQNFAGEKSSKNEDFVKLVAQNNVRNTIAQIRAKSEILRTMEAKGEIKIVGAFYVLRTGELQFLD